AGSTAPPGVAARGTFEPSVPFTTRLASARGRVVSRKGLKRFRRGSIGAPSAQITQMVIDQLQCRLAFGFVAGKGDGDLIFAVRRLTSNRPTRFEHRFDVSLVIRPTHAVRRDPSTSYVGLRDLKRELATQGRSR